MEFRVLGPLEATDGSNPLALGRPKPRALLARLLLDVGRTVPIARLVDDLWGEAAPASAVKMVQIHVSQLRKVMPAGSLRTRPPGYALEADPDTVDLTRFIRLREEGRIAMAAGDAARASALLGEALALWRGPALAEFSEPFAHLEGPRLEELRLTCLEHRVDADLALGRHADLVGELQALVARDPLRETPHAQLMLALYRAGRQAEALAAYDRFRRRLDDELGIEPAAPLKALQRQILNHDDHLAAPERPEPPRQEAAPLSPARPIVTLLFTDVVGSTELLTRLGDDAADQLRRRHFALLREALAAHGGTEVKSLGDGLMVVLPSAVDAVRCAVAMQRAVSAEDGPGLRIGLHAGEPAREGDDYFGTPVVVARRLCDRAAGGQILTSDLVRGLLGSRGDADLRPVGRLRLKGLGEPVAAFEIAWGGRAAAAGEPPAPGRAGLPAPVAGAGRTAFVGREEDLERLEAAWERAQAGSVQVAMIGGEPGIGKTRLAGELARAVHARGATVLFGRCDEDLGIPYQPFAEALRSGVAAGSGVSLDDLELGRLLPETSADTAAAPADPADQRGRLFDAVATGLERLGRGQALIAILDDLHWADRPTLLLLRYLVRSPATPPVLVVGTYRDTELSPGHPLSETLADLRRGVPVERVSLTGLTSGDLAAMLAAISGREPPAAFVQAIHRETEGNPFFAEEVLRHLTESGALDADDGRWAVARAGIPESVKETIAQRLARLPAGCDAGLAMAAVLGRTWEYRVAQAMDPRHEDELMRCVEAAVAAQLIGEADGGRSPAYTFSHALVRETLYGGLSLPRRQALHLRAAQAIERVHAGELDDHAAALALHHRLAGTLAAPEVTLRWLLRAGELASAQLAWEDAAEHLDAAAALMPEAGVADAHRIALVERLGDLKYAAGFDLVEGTAQLEAALAHHDAAGDRVRAARLRSKLGRNLTTFHGPVQDVDRGRALLETAEGVLREAGDPVPLASVYIGLATAACWANDVPDVLRTAERAMAIATESGHEVLWANAAVLYGNGMTWAGRGQEAETHLEAAWEIGDRLNHPWVAFLATWCRQGDVCWRGEIVQGRRICERELAKPRTLQAPGQRDYLESLLAWPAALAGDLALAAEIAERSSPDVVPPFAAGLVQLMAGDPRTAAATIERWRDACVRRGNAWTAMVFEHDIAQAQWALGDPAVDATFGRIIAAATAGGGGLFEFMYRCQHVRRLVEREQTGEARRELERCRELFAAGDRWGAREGDLALAEATVAAAGGEDAERGFTDAAEIYARFGVVWEQAAAFEQQSLARSPRDPAGAVETLDRALDLYDRHGASRLWRERARRRRAALARSGPGEGSPRETGPPLASAPALFGRGREQAALEQILTDARLGRSGVLLMTGEPGIGKSALLRWAVDAGRSEGMEVLSARGIESEAEVPFGGLLELVRPALPGLERIPPAQAEALRSALDLGPTVERDRFLVGAATLNLLSVRSERAPIVVAIDDAHWLDDSSLAAILFAARRLLVDSVAVVFAARTGEARGLGEAGLPELALGGVDAQAVAQIVARHAVAPLAPEMVERLGRATGGNPLALVELSATGSGLGPGPADGPLEARTSVASAYAKRIAELPLPARRILALAAAEDSGRLVWVGAAADELGLELSDLAPGERAGFVSISFGVLAWRHPLVRSAAYGAVSADERRAMHAALARALPASEGDRGTWHRASAALGADEDVAAALEEAARRARARSAYAAAATAAERAGQLSPSDQARARRLFAAAEAAWLGGQADRALARLEEGLALAPEPRLRAEMQHLRGQAVIRAGDVTAGYGILVDGAGAIEALDPGKAVVMLAEATDACVYAGRPAAMLAPARRAFALLTDASGERERFFANLALGTALIFGGEGEEEGARRLKEAVAVLEGSDVLSGDPRSLSAAAVAPLWLREAGIGARLIDRAIEVARSQGALGALPFALTLAAREAAASDRWAIGQALFEEAIGLARETDQAMPLCGALAWLAGLQARRGDVEACERGAQEAIDLSDRHGLGLFRVWALDALAELDLVLGRLTGAMRRLSEKEATLARLGVTDPDLSPVPELVEAGVRAGDGADRSAAVEAFARAAEVKRQPWALARLARTKGLLADPGEAERHFADALRHHEASSDPFEEARTRLCFGERLRRAGERVRAREQLRAALDAFETLGAGPWAERARTELMASGERARRRDPSTLDDLTPQELQIGRALASGLTTREAAAKLFLSPKTIEYHLRNVYRKLGIHSRDELAAKL